MRWSEVGAWTWGVRGEGRGVATADDEDDMVAGFSRLDRRSTS